MQTLAEAGYHKGAGRQVDKKAEGRRLLEKVREFTCLAGKTELESIVQ